jgi:hypothetical protein
VFLKYLLLRIHEHGQGEWRAGVAWPPPGPGGFSGITKTRVSMRARREALTLRSPSLTFAHKAHQLERRVVVSAKVSSGQKCCLSSAKKRQAIARWKS